MDLEVRGCNIFLWGRAPPWRFIMMEYNNYGSLDIILSLICSVCPHVQYNESTGHWDCPCNYDVEHCFWCSVKYDVDLCFWKCACMYEGGCK